MRIKKGLKILYLLGFVLALSTALPAYIRSTFLEEFVTESWVGLFFIGAAVFSLISINFFPYFIKKFTNYRLILIVLGINIISILLLITTHSPYWAFVYFIILTTSATLSWINMDVFVERFTSNPTTGRTRTIYFTFLNLGWVLSPIAAGYIAGESNYRLVFLTSVLFLLVVFIGLIANRKTLEDHVPYKHSNTLKTLKNIWHNTNLRYIFTIAFLLDFFYSFAVIYIPIYLHQYLGFSWLTIGGIFTFMLLPFIIFEIPAGVLADKYTGERKILTLGFLILSASVMLIFFTKSQNPVVWALILFMSRSGAALIEAMRESYFFKIIDVEDIDYINFFRNNSPLGFLMGAAIGVLVLKFLPIQYIFIFLSALLLTGIHFTWKLKKVRK